MRCTEFEDRIAVYVEGDLQEGASDVERHLAQCSECAEFLSELRESQTALKLLAGAAPDPSIRRRVLLTVEAGRRRMQWLAVAAALLLAIGAGAMWRWQSALKPIELALEMPAPPPLPDSRGSVLEVPRVPTPRRALPRRSPSTEPRPSGSGPVLLARNTEPLVFKMLTDDPDVVIIWLVEGKEQQNEERTFDTDAARGE